MALTEEQIRRLRASIESSSNKVDNNFYQRELAASERQAAQAAAARGALSEGQYQRANQAVNVGDILTAQILSNMQQGAYNQPKQSTVSQQARSRFESSPLTGATTVTDSFHPMASLNNNQPQPVGPVSTTPKVLGSTSSVTRAVAARQNIDYLQNEINNADNYYQDIAGKAGLPGAAQAAMQAQMESAARKDALSKALQAAYGEYTTAAKNGMDEADSYRKEYEALDKQEEKLTAEYVRAREEALDMGVADTEHLRQVLEQQQQVRNRKQQLRQMADEAKSFYYASAQMEDGFYEIGRYRPEIKDETYKIVNGDPQAVAAAYGKLKAKDTLQDDELPLTQLTDDEKRIYNYLYMQEGKEAAQKFLDYITPYLRNRLAEKQYGEMNGVQKALYWLPAGMDQWARGIENFGAMIKGDENVSPSTTALQSGMVREEAYDKSKVAGTLYDIGQITANQIPNLILGYATGGVAEAANMSQLGATILAKTVQGANTFASSGGNYYQEAIAEGLDVSQARSYALLSGAAEAGLESVLGGFEGITGIGTGKLAKLAGGIKNGLLRAVATAGAEGLGEGIEEGLQDILSPLFKNILTHSKDYEIDWAGVGQSFIMGALSTVPMNATTSGAEAIIKRAAVGEHTYFDGFNELMGNGVPDYYKGLAGVDEIQRRMDKLSKNTQMTATEKFQAQQQGTYLMAAYEALDTLQAQIKNEQAQPEETPKRQFKNGYIEEITPNETTAPAQPASGENINKNVDNINVGVDERTVTNGQTGNNILNGSSQRNVGIGAGEQTGAVAAGTGAVQGRPRNAINQGATVNGRQAVLNDYVRAGGQLTSTTGKAAGIRAATDATLEIWTPELIAKDKELSQIVETNKSRGIETVITNGGVEVNAGIDDATGEKITKRANGIYTIDKNGKIKIFIDAMSSAYTATQLNEHETFHALVGTDPTLKSKALRKVAQSMSGDELRKVLEGYVRQYSGVYDGKVDNAFMAAMADGEAIMQDAAARNILEEVAADAYADINRHGDLGTLKETVRTEVESQQAANQTAQTPQETRGPPEESRYLLSETTDSKPVTPNESEVKEKFSLDEPVEYTKDFVALHNLTEDNLLDSIKLGGLPSPSIAIVDAKQGHSKYGPISLVFRSETIDPEIMRQNKVYGSDAWTPTASNARVEYQVNRKAANNLEKLIYDLSGQIANGMFQNSSTLRSLGVEDDTTDNAKELARRLSRQDAVKAAYLAGNNKNVELVYQPKKYGQWGNEFSQMLIDGFGYQQLAAMVARIETNEGLTEQELEQFREMWAENKYDTCPQRIKERNGEEVVRKIARNLANDLREGQIEHAIKDAWEMYSDGGKVSDEIDRYETQRNLSKAAPDEEVAEWILPEVEEILGEPGVYNGKDKYTNSGASRSFKQLHWEYTAENIVKAMQKAESRGANYWGVGGEGLTAVASTDFKSIDQMHQEENRLMQESDETHRARLEELDEMISDIIPDIRNTNKMHSSYEWEENDIIGTVMMQAAQVARTPAAIQKAFAKEGYTINAETTQKLLDMYNQAAQIPTGYFEAKPQRVVGFDEVVAAVVPDNMSVKTYNELTNAGVDVKLYPTGDEQARLDTINGLENIRFSLDEPVEYTDDLIAMHNLSVDNAIRTLQNEGMPSPSIAIKNASMGHDAFGEITFLFGRDTVDPQADKRNEIYESDAYTATYPKTNVIDDVDIALADALNSGAISNYNYDTAEELIITAAQEIQQAIETLEPGQESPKEGRTGFWNNDTVSKAALYLLANPSDELLELLPEKDVFDLDYDDYWFLGDDLRRMVQNMSAEEKSKAEAWVDNRVSPQNIEEIAAQMQRKPFRTDVPQVNTIEELRTLSSERAAEDDRSYAEAKPRRAVYSEEIVGAVLPDVFEDSADFFKYSQLQMLLSENGIPVSYYDKNEKQSRLEAINDLADSYPSIRFSIEDEPTTITRDEFARNVMNLFQIPKVAQEDWTSKTAQFADLVLKNPEAAEQYENAIYNTLIGEGQRKTAADEQSAYTLKQLRNSRVYVPDSVKSDINRDNWNAYRNAAMTQKIYYTNDPNDTGLDAWAQDTLAGIDPRFRSVTDPADILELMNTVIDEGKPKIRTVAEQFAADNNMDQAQAKQGLRDDLHDLVENLITQSRLEQQLRAGNYYQRQERKIKKMQTAAEVAQAQMVEAQNRLNQQQTALDTQQETMRQREDDLIRRETALEWKNISRAIPDATPEQLIAVAEDMRANGVYTLDDYLNQLTLNDLMASNEPEPEKEYSPEERRAMEKMAERKRNEGIGDISPELQKAMDAMGAKDVNDYMRILDNKSKEEHAERVRTKLREEFKGTELMNKYGVQIAGTLTDYSDVQMLRGRDKAYYDAKRAADKAIKRLRPTEQEEQYARLVSNGIFDYADIDTLPDSVDREKVNELIDYFDALRALSVDIIANRKRQINDQLIDETMPEIFKNTDTYKPLTSRQLEYSTPTRIARRMFGEDANKVISEVFDPIAANDAGKMRFVNGIVEKMSKFTDGNGKKTKLNKAENELVAMMLDNALDNKPFELEADGRRQISAEAEAAGRLMANLDDKGRIKGDRKTWEQIEKKLQKELEHKNLKSLPAEEMRKAEYIATELRYKALENGIDKVHVKNAVEAYKTLYNELYDIQNDFYVAHGFHGIGFQKNYNPRMQPETVKRALSDMAQMLGIKESTGGIPASIAGLTSEFKPSKRWNAHDQSRTDNMTTYFAAQESLDNYLSYLSDILYHTDDIMRIRAMEKYFRAQYAPDMIREEMSLVRELARGSIAEQRAYLEDKGIIKHTDVLSDADITLAMDKYIEDRYANMNDTTTMGKFTAWAKNYGDILAGKQSMADRSWEYSYGRETLNTGNRLLNTFARSAVAASLTSTLNQTSQLPMILNDIGPRYTAQALAEIATGKLRKIDFTSQSDYLTGKQGVNYLTPDKAGEKVISAMYVPAEFVDNLMSQLTVRGEYLKQISRGRSEAEAMRLADAKGRQIMASRLKGSAPTAFAQKNAMSRIINMFAVEALNGYEYAIRDFPSVAQETGNYVTEKMAPKIGQEAAEAAGKRAAAVRVAQLIVGNLIGAFVLNRLGDKLYGGTPAQLDLAGMALSAFASGYSMDTNAMLEQIITNGLDSIDGDFDFKKAGQQLGGDIVNDVPMARNFSALLGIGDNTLPLPNFGEAKDLWKAVQSDLEDDNKLGTETIDAIINLAAEFVPGGRQLKRTWRGVQSDINDGVYYGFGDDRRLAATGARTFAEEVQAVMFGTSSLQSVKDFYASGDTALSSKQTRLYDELVSHGADKDEMYNAIHEYRNISNDKSLDSVTRGQQERALIAGLNISDRDKNHMYNTLSSNESREEKFDTLINAGISFAKIASIYDEQLKENDTYPGETKEERAFEHWSAEIAAIDAQRITDQQKQLAFETFMSKGEKRNEGIKELLDSGMSWSNVMQVLRTDKHNAIYDDTDSKLTSTQKEQNIRAAISDMDISDAEKFALYSTYTEKIALSPAAGRAEKFTEMSKAKFSWKEAGQVYDKYKELYDLGEAKKIDATEAAMKFAKFLDEKKFSENKKEKAKDLFKFYQMFPAEAERYEKFTGVGLSSNDAYNLSEAMKKLVPPEGKEQVTNLQRYRAITDTILREEDQLKAFEAQDTQHTTYSKVKVLWDNYGIKPEDWITYQEYLIEVNAENDNNSSISQSEAWAALNRMPWLSGGQKDAIFTLTNTGWKSGIDYNALNAYKTLKGLYDE